MSSQNQEGRIQLALRAFNARQFHSYRAAAVAYNVHHSSLSRRANGIMFRRETLPNCQKLAQTVEQTIVQYILDLDLHGFAPRLCEVEDMANTLLAERGQPPIGKLLATRFVTRTGELKTAFDRSKDYHRLKQEDPDVINAWFERVRATIDKYGVQQDDIHNFDETGFPMGVIGTMTVVTGSERRTRPTLTQPGNREWVTVIQC